MSTYRSNVRILLYLIKKMEDLFGKEPLPGTWIFASSFGVAYIRCGSKVEPYMSAQVYYYEEQLYINGYLCPFECLTAFNNHLMIIAEMIKNGEDEPLN